MSDSNADEHSGDFLRLFLDHRSRLEAMIFRAVGCRFMAADLVQDLFLRLWNRPLAGEESVRYLFRSARNLAIDHLRSEGVRRSAARGLLPEQQAADPVSPEDAAAARAELASLGQVLGGLPIRARRVFLLNKVHERPYPEIARALGVSVSTVEKDMMRALAACRRHQAQMSGKE